MNTCTAHERARRVAAVHALVFEARRDELDREAERVIRAGRERNALESVTAHA